MRMIGVLFAQSLSKGSPARPHDSYFDTPNTNGQT